MKHAETRNPAGGAGKRPAVRPFVKWAGGKGQLLADIRKAYPPGLGKSVRKYAEPFVGGGAVLFDVLGSFELDEVYISDTNAELINAYRTIRDDVRGLMDLLSALRDGYLPLDDEARKAFYYARRDRFNELKIGGTGGAESAALFIFLNRTCFNGLYRVNRRNLFNVPTGSYRNPVICDAENLLAVSRALRNVTVVCGDYRESRGFVDENTFVYFDPPYRPLTATSAFTAYTENEFNDSDQRALAEFVQELDEAGAFVAVSNSDPKNTDPDDDFFDVLYARQRIIRVSAARMINSDASARGRISELLICNH